MYTKLNLFNLKDIYNLETIIHQIYIHKFVFKENLPAAQKLVIINDCYNQIIKQVLKG